MKLALALTLASTLTGCVMAPTLSQHSTDNLQEMRADLRACTLENLAFEFIPDFGITSDLHRNKCMRQRGWAATPREGVYDYARIRAEPLTPTGTPAAIDTSCPPGSHKDGQGCRYDAGSPPVRFHTTTARTPLPEPSSDAPPAELSPRPDWCTAENLIWRGDHCEVRPPVKTP
jgi:hypothetical protein